MIRTMSCHSARRRRRRFLSCARRRNVVTKITVLIMILLLCLLTTILAAQEAHDQQVCTTGDKGGEEGSCHSPQQQQAEEDVTVEKLEKADDVDIRIADASDEIISKDDSSSVQACRDQHPNCASWATYGECDKNPNYAIALSRFLRYLSDGRPRIHSHQFWQDTNLGTRFFMNFTVQDMKDAIHQQDVYMQNVRSNDTTPQVVLEHFDNQNRRATYSRSSRTFFSIFVAGRNERKDGVVLG